MRAPRKRENGLSLNSCSEIRVRELTSTGPKQILHQSEFHPSAYTLFLKKNNIGLPPIRLPWPHDSKRNKKGAKKLRFFLFTLLATGLALLAQDRTNQKPRQLSRLPPASEASFWGAIVCIVERGFIHAKTNTFVYLFTEENSAHE